MSLCQITYVPMSRQKKYSAFRLAVLFFVITFAPSFCGNTDETDILMLNSRPNLHLRRIIEQIVTRWSMRILCAGFKIRVTWLCKTWSGVWRGLRTTLLIYIKVSVSMGGVMPQPQPFPLEESKSLM